MPLLSAALTALVKDPYLWLLSANPWTGLWSPLCSQPLHLPLSQWKMNGWGWDHATRALHFPGLSYFLLRKAFLVWPLLLAKLLNLGDVSCLKSQAASPSWDQPLTSRLGSALVPVTSSLWSTALCYHGSELGQFQAISDLAFEMWWRLCNDIEKWKCMLPYRELWPQGIPDLIKKGCKSRGSWDYWGCRS